MNRKLITLTIAAAAVSSCLLLPAARAQDKDSTTATSDTTDTANGGGATVEKEKGLWTDVPTGFALAKKDNKPIITDFYTDWCGWCKVMDKKTFRNPQVSKLMSDNFVLVRANAEDGGPGERLSRQQGINGYPTVIIFDSSGQAKVKMVGYQEIAPFTAKLNTFLGKQ